jgi:hypothetical protein
VIRSSNWDFRSGFIGGGFGGGFCFGVWHFFLDKGLSGFGQDLRFWERIFIIRI